MLIICTALYIYTYNIQKKGGNFWRWKRGEVKRRLDTIKCVWIHDKMLGDVYGVWTVVKKTKAEGWAWAVLVITDEIGMGVNLYSKKH